MSLTALLLQIILDTDVLSFAFLLKEKKQGKDVVDTEEESSEEEPAVEIWGRDANGRYAREHDSDFEREFIESDDQDVDKLDLPGAYAFRP